MNFGKPLRRNPVTCVAAALCLLSCPARVPAAEISSEDSLIPNFHSLGEISGRANIFRSGSPVGDIAERLKDGRAPAEADREEARARMQHLYSLGIRTVVSLQRQEPPSESVENPEYPAVALEQAAAQEAGLAYVAYSMSNRGKDPRSLQYISDEAALQLMEAIAEDIIQRSENGGVVFHCKSGKDRTGLVAAFLRVRYQGWSAEQAIIEMRRNGHVWKSFLKPGNSYSWHEELLRAMAGVLAVRQ